MPLHKKIKKQKEANLRKPLLASTATPGTNLLKGRAARSIQQSQQNQLNEVLPTGGAADPPSAFRASRGGPQPLTISATTEVIYNIEELDLLEEYNTATGDFIAQQAGLYSFNASIFFVPETDGIPFFVSLYIRRNGGIEAATEAANTGNGRISVVPSVSAVLQLQAGDLVDVAATTSIDGEISPLPVYAPYTRFEGVFIPEAE